MKTVIQKIHLWLGMITGPIVFIIALTGCIYTFQEEIQDATQPYRFVQQQTKPFVPPSELRDRVQSVFPDKHLHALMYHTPERAAKAIFFKPYDYYFLVYMDPYSGKILHVHDVTNSFFGFILDGHFYLWLPENIGQWVVSSATLLFLCLLISGLYLWWPRNKNNRKPKFTIKWQARWRRKNYDLHSVLGMYTALFAFVLLLTGLMWGFDWVRNGVYKTISGGASYQEYVEPSSQIPQIHQAFTLEPLDSVYKIMRRDYPKAAWIELHLPESTTGSIAANANPDATTYWKIDYRYFDQYSLTEKSVDHHWGRLHEASNADKLMRMQYDIHVGAIAGIPGKILAFLVSLIIATMPISGFLIWYGRKYKK